jgi:hypothetical protein
VLEHHGHLDRLRFGLAGPADPDADTIAHTVTVAVDLRLDEHDLLDRVREREHRLRDAVLNAQPRRRRALLGGRRRRRQSEHGECSHRSDCEPQLTS